MVNNVNINYTYRQQQLYIFKMMKVLLKGGIIMKGINKLIKILFLNMMMVSIILISFTQIVHAFPGGRTVRLYGVDRFKTAAEISRQGWKSSEYVILATGEGMDKFADALAGTPLSLVYDCPVLLTNSNGLNMDTLAEIITLGANKVILLGGYGVISEAVETHLKNMGMDVTRLYGQDRYETAVRIGQELRKSRTFTKAVLTTAWEFQYSMMIAPFAASKCIPILFTDRDTISEVTKNALVEFGIKDIEIIGNNTVVSLNVESELKKMGINVDRIEGSTMQKTNINIVKKYGESTGSIALARDDFFADALAGAPFAAKNNVPIFLVGQELVNADIYNYVTGLSTTVNYIFGGPGAVSDGVVNMLIPGTIRTNQSNSDSVGLFPSLSLGNIKSGNSPGNINNLGIAALYEDHIYYRNINDNCTLYKSRADGTSPIRLTDDRPFSINVVDDWIYYVNQSNNNHIYKIKTDGTGKVKVINDEACYLAVEGEWIYYKNLGDWGLYKIKTDGAHKTKLGDDNVHSINPGGEFIYCCFLSDSNRVYSMKADGTEKKAMPVDNASNMVASQDWIYYQDLSDRSRVYKVNTSRPDIDTVITSDEAYSMNVEGDWIYYANGNDGFKLYKIKTDGSSKTKLNNSSSIFINIVGDKIYFVNISEGNRLYEISTDGTLEQEVGIQSSPDQGNLPF